MKTRFAFVALIAIALAALIGYAIGQQSVQWPALLSSARLNNELSARTGASADINTQLGANSAYINGLDRDLVVRVVGNSVVKVFALCDPAIRSTVLNNPFYHQRALARYCAERNPSK